MLLVSEEWVRQRRGTWRRIQETCRSICVKRTRTGVRNEIITSCVSLVVGGFDSDLLPVVGSKSN